MIQIHKNYLQMVLEKFFIFIFIFICVTSLSGQVTIGSAKPPMVGALLDIKEQNGVGPNSSKGLLMPRVFLNNESELATSLDATAVSGSLDASQHIGLSVYNINNCITRGKGFYVWDGLNWVFLGLHVPRRLEYFGGHLDVGMALQGSAITRIGATCSNNTNIILNDFQTIEGSIVVNGYASITKLMVASDGVIHGIGTAELVKGNGEFCNVAFYWNENIAPVFLIPPTGTLDSFISFSSVLEANDIIEYNGRIYVCGSQYNSGSTFGFIWSTPLTSLGSLDILLQKFSEGSKSFSVFNNRLVMLYSADSKSNAIRDLVLDKDLFVEYKSIMPNDILLTLGNDLYVAGLVPDWAVLYNTTTKVTTQIVENKSTSNKARVRGVVAVDRTIYIVGGTDIISGSNQPSAFFWDSVHGLNSNYIDLTGRPTSEWDPGVKIGVFEQIVVEDGIIHLTMEADLSGQSFYWNNVNNEIVNFGKEGQKISPKSFVVVYR